MTLPIDGAGRVVIPKRVRDKLGLHAGSSLELVETREGVTLKPSEQKSPLRKIGRFLVITSELLQPASTSPKRSIEEDREARDRKVWGL